MSYQTGQKLSYQTGQKRYGKAPMDVLEDSSLSADAKVVYAWLAMHVFQGNVCSVGCRRIAEKVNLHKDTVTKCLHQLENAGHISITGEGKRRRFYTFHSQVFAQKQGKADVLVSSPKGKRLVSLDNERHGLPKREEVA